jgi:MtfA peptidase
LPAGFLGHTSHAGARREWLTRLGAAYEQLTEQHEAAQRFGAATPWLDAYGTTGIEEFLPVACEAFFTAPELLRRDFPDLFALLVAFFNPTNEQHVLAA